MGSFLCSVTFVGRIVVFFFTCRRLLLLFWDLREDGIIKREKNVGNCFK